MSAKASPALPLSKRQYDILDKYVRKRSTSNHEVKRIKIVLKGSEGQSNFSISKEIDLGVYPIAKWRNRWLSSYEEIQIYEQGESGQGVSDKDLLKKMLSVLQDLPRTGAPARLSMSQKQQIVALACCAPSDYGIPITSWTHEMLAHIAKAEKIVENISPRYVGKILKKSGLTST